MKIRRGLEFNPNITPLPGRVQIMVIDLTNSDDDLSGSHTMKQVQLTEMRDRELCERKFVDSGLVPIVWRVDDSWICAERYRNESNALCKGDVGAPLVRQELGKEPGKEESGEEECIGEQGGGHQGRRPNL